MIWSYRPSVLSCMKRSLMSPTVLRRYRTVCTQTAGMDGDEGRVVSSEEGRVDVEAVDPPWDSQLDDAPVMTFQRRVDRIRHMML